MDDLVKRLRAEGKDASGLACGKLCLEAAARIEADAKRIATLAVALQGSARDDKAILSAIGEAREAAIEECARVAEWAVWRPLSPDHVRASSPKDVAAAIRALGKEKAGG